MGELTPEEVLVNLFTSGDWIEDDLRDPAETARLIVQFLRDSGFRIVPVED
jgi:hypothetical protein